MLRRDYTNIGGIIMNCLKCRMSFADDEVLMIIESSKAPNGK